MSGTTKSRGCAATGRKGNRADVWDTTVMPMDVMLQESLNYLNGTIWTLLPMVCPIISDDQQLHMRAPDSMIMI